VVTIGGGHGQASLLGALARLRCDVTALVSVSDDGGCSGRLREELGMPPPGDVRRCLLALATRPRLAARFDERLPVAPSEAARSAGNLVLAEMFRELGGLQLAVDWAARLLGCRGRVVPVAETGGVLRAYDQHKGELRGESTIERESATTIVVNVEGPEHASPGAKRALADADLVFIGPGSFVGSTLAALTTADHASAVVSARARRVFVQNLARETDVTFGTEEHERIVKDHLVIKSGGEPALLDVLAHGDAPGHHAAPRGDGSWAYASPLCRGGGAAHDEDLLARALEAHFGLALDAARSTPTTDASEAEAEALFTEVLATSRRRLRLEFELERQKRTLSE
jgi:uncharacterized cofD-like protein